MIQHWKTRSKLPWLLRHPTSHDVQPGHDAKRYWVRKAPSHCWHGCGDSIVQDHVVGTRHYVNKETDRSVRDRVMAVHHVTSTDEDIAGTIIEGDSDVNDNRPQPQSKVFVKRVSNKKYDINRAMANLDAVTRTDVEAIFENCLTKWANRLHLRIIKPVRSSIQDH